MALTAEQENQLEFQEANMALMAAAELKRHKLDMVRLAKDILSEHDRNKPVGERGFTASDITALSDQLITYVNS